MEQHERTSLHHDDVSMLKNKWVWNEDFLNLTTVGLGVEVGVRDLLLSRASYGEPPPNKHTCTMQHVLKHYIIHYYS